tara:strand:+ start:711 stop:944 length:234 start_codon:yes stop_codon:yes gene_type:complete
MIETLFAVLLITNGSIIETVPTDGMSDCLKIKRTAMQNIGVEQEGIFMQCVQVEAEVEIDMGRKRIVKILTENPTGN